MAYTSKLLYAVFHPLHTAAVYDWYSGKANLFSFPYPVPADRTQSEQFSLNILFHNAAQKAYSSRHPDHTIKYRSPYPDSAHRRLSLARAEPFPDPVAQYYP